MAKALYRAEHNLGKTLPKELSNRVNELLKDHLQANLPIGAAGKTLRAAVVALPLESPALDIVQRESIEIVLASEVKIEKGEMTYIDVTKRLQELAETRFREGKLNQLEYNALKAQYDYMLTGHQRFNSFNKVEIVRKQTDVVLDALMVEFEANPRMRDELGSIRRELKKWSAGRDGQAADGAAVAKDVRLETLVSRLSEEYKARFDKQPEAFTPSQQAAINKALDGIKASPWVVRDAKGSPIPGWRPKQYVRLMQAFLGEGSHARHVESAAGDIFASMKEAYGKGPKAAKLLETIEGHTTDWVAEAGKTKAEKVSMTPLLEKIDRAITSAEGLSPAEAAGFRDLAEAVGKLEREGSYKGILTTGRKGGDVELFIKAPTSLGKTLLAYEGLLPYLEAEAAASGRKVMFLTFNTKLQAQAEFDFLAFNKLGSEVKFETYEGLKTMIAEGKTKGRSVAEDYLMLQDEMDAAGQQPALTIGMVTGRVSRLNSQTTALNGSNKGLQLSIETLNSVRVEGAEVQVQRVKSISQGLSPEHVPGETLVKIRGAADDALAAIGQLKRAKGPEEIRLAEKALSDAADVLRRQAAGLPQAEAEAANTMVAALKRMNESLDSRPSTHPEVRERIAAEMKDAFVNQHRLMLLTETVEGLARLPAEAKKARVALEAKIERLQKELAEAEQSSSEAGRRRTTLLEEQIEIAKTEKALVERFDGVDASARLFTVDSQIAAIRANQASGVRTSVNPKLERLMRESIELEAAGTPASGAKRAVVEARLEQLLKELGRKGGSNEPGVVQAYRAETSGLVKIEKAIGETKGRSSARPRARNRPPSSRRNFRRSRPTAPPPEAACARRSSRSARRRPPRSSTASSRSRRPSRPS
ncbi:MAG: hypothetical protein M0D55_14030 [Elusimicrobiota bacterium]|nr:MAG: hypothetical protein M0D55_14030 [Elusimicrobiota bacterium]